jgi:hypothetical protein
MGLEKEFMREMVMDEGLGVAVLSFWRRARRREGLKGRMISPEDEMRPGTSTVCVIGFEISLKDRKNLKTTSSRGARGSGLGQVILQKQKRSFNPCLESFQEKGGLPSCQSTWHM